MLLRGVAVALLMAVAFCSADTLTLRSGRVITGQYLGGDARHVRMAVGDRVDTFNVEDVGTLEFTGASPASPAAQAADPVPASGIQMPAGTPITVRMIESVDSNVAKLGHTFRASVDEPVLVNGQTAIPRGAEAIVQLVVVKRSAPK